MKLLRLFHNFGIENPNLVEFLDVVFTMLVVGLIGWIVYIVAKKYLPRLIRRIVGASRSHWSTWLLDQTFFNRLGGLIVPIILRTGISSASWHYMWIFDRIVDNSKILAATGMTQAELMPLYDGLEHEISRCPADVEWPVNERMDSFLANRK